MSFVDLFKKKTIKIMKEEGITQQNVSESRNDPAVIAAAARVADHAIPLGEYYKMNTWCGDNSYVDEKWSATEKELREMAKAMKKKLRA